MLNIIPRNGSCYEILTLSNDLKRLIYQLLVTLQRVSFIMEGIVEIILYISNLRR